MTSSNVRKLQNEMVAIEEESDRFVPLDSYYCINITIPELDSDTNDLAIKFLTKNMKHQPLFTYSFDKTLLLFYSCMEEGKSHYLNGSHHSLISEYTSILVLETGKPVNCSIVEFDSRVCVSTYFLWKTHDNSKKCMVGSSDGKISFVDTKTKTSNELIDILKTLDITWEGIPTHVKFGTFYKLKKRKGKVVISKLSENFDSRENKRYSNFMFD